MTAKNSKNLKSKKSSRKADAINVPHYTHIGQLLALITVLIAVYYFRAELNPLIVTAFVLAYFSANAYHAYSQKRLTPERLLEYGIISLVCEFLLLNYVV